MTTVDSEFQPLNDAVPRSNEAFASRFPGILPCASIEESVAAMLLLSWVMAVP